MTPDPFLDALVLQGVDPIHLELMPAVAIPVQRADLQVFDLLGGACAQRRCAGNERRCLVLLS